MMQTSLRDDRANRQKRRSGVVVPNAPRWHQRLAAWCLVAFARVLASTLRYYWNDEAGFVSPGSPEGPAIFVFWHNRLGLCLQAYRHSRAHRRSQGVVALVSASRDGAFLSSILNFAGVHPVRGSSSRRGPQALLELTTWAGRGYDLAITPDGPRGPCYRVQEGVIYLAQITGLPIVPFSFHAHSKLQVRSWDRFQIPFPFSRCDMVTGRPIRVPREAMDEAREALRVQLEQELMRITRD